MTTTPAPADLQRWREELARNPASLAFLPLARAYRRQGRLDHAMSLCHRGLEQHPTHIEGHALLALLYLENGDRARAADEWSTILRLKPGNFEALRGMGFRYLEQGDIEKAKQHLERAALIRPTDPAVQEALRLLRTRMAEAAATADAALDPVEVGLATDPGAEFLPPAGGGQEGGVLEGDSRSAAPADQDAPVLELEEGDAIDILELGDAEAPAAADANGAVSGTPLPASPRWGEELTAAPANHSSPEELAAGHADHAPARAGEPTVEQQAAVGYAKAAVEPQTEAEQTVVGRGEAAAGEAADPTRLFDSMLEGPMLGVLLVDGQGRVLAGRLAGAAAAQSEAVGALIGGTADEAARVVEHLGLRAWKGMMLECGSAVVQVLPAGDDAMLVVVARRDSPRGWLARAANQAVALSEPLLRSDT